MTEEKSEAPAPAPAASDAPALTAEGEAPKLSKNQLKKLKKGKVWQKINQIDFFLSLLNLSMVLLLLYLLLLYTGQGKERETSMG